MERVTDVLNNIYNTGMGHLENRRKQRQFEMQGQQFNLDQQLKQAQLGGAMQDQKLKQFRLDAIQRMNGSGNQFAQPTAQSVGAVEQGASPQTNVKQARLYDPISGQMYDNPDYLNPLEQQKMKKLQMEKQETEKKADLSMQGLLESSEAAMRNIQQIRGNDNENKKFFGRFGQLPSLAAPSSWLPFDGMTYDDRENWESNFETLKDKLVLDTMMKLKEASATGSTGFGNMSEREGKRLENAATALRRSNSWENAQRNLAELESAYQAIISRVNKERGTQQTSVPEWVPQKMADKYAEAKRYDYSDEQIKKFITSG